MKEDSSFRDPDGFVFYQEKQLYRAINISYNAEYEYLIGSGLYNRLINDRYLIPHKEVNITTEYKELHKIIKPEKIPFISYPYEWSFSQLKDAALLTLSIQKIAVEYGMSLKDASSYNVQFYEGNAIFIDTLSFEKYIEGQPWSAYKQFCQHFLAPIALMAKVDIRLNCLLKDFLDGIPLDLCCNLLPSSSKFNIGLLLHMFLHSSAQLRYNSSVLKVAEIQKKFSKVSLLILIDNLTKTIEGLTWKTSRTEWGEYYSAGVHLPEYTEYKMKIVSEYIDHVNPATLWDFGSNTGFFSRIASDKGIQVISFDIDPTCVENSYRDVRKKAEKKILPLLLDLTNPSPSIGWANNERKDISKRGPVDMLMVLALIHHLAISDNLPLNKIAGYFSKLAKWLIIEFVPKSDEKVKILLTNREDIFPEYTKDGFEKVFLEYFDIICKNQNSINNRVMYLMKLK